jgi:hypothetical protein
LVEKTRDALIIKGLLAFAFGFGYAPIGDSALLLTLHLRLVAGWWLQGAELLQPCHMWRNSGQLAAIVVDVNDESSDKAMVCGDSCAALPSLSTLQGIGGLIQLQRLGD